jgi:hypothetical protein
MGNRLSSSRCGDVVQMKGITSIHCLKCGRKVTENFRAKWRHMVRYHQEELAKRIIPLIFLPAEELKAMGAEVARSFIRKIQK